MIGLSPVAHAACCPATAAGFFYTSLLPEDRHFTEDDLGRIEKRMKEKAGRRVPFTREVMPRDQARSFFTAMDQPFKVDIIDRIPAEVDSVGIYRTGDFVDLCRGPHVPD